MLQRKVEKIKSLLYKFPDHLSRAIEIELKSQFNLTFKNSSELASCVQKMSDFYIQNPTAKTPWNERWCAISQLVYYLPLNYLRAQRVINEAARLKFFESFDSFIDYGSGLGSLTLQLEGIFKNGEFVETSKLAKNIYQSIRQELKVRECGSSNNSKKTLHTFSYSLTESLNALSSDAYGYLIVEPSTRDDGRELMQLRETLISKGYFAWAPCTHQGKCPLLHHSQKDWCHDRLHIDMPDWFLEMEKKLSFKNQTITLSYLLMSKDHPTQISQVRTVGDTQEEKGKSKIMICRGENREFLSWLHRDYKSLEFPRGYLIDLPDYEVKANELRIRKN